MGKFEALEVALQLAAGLKSVIDVVERRNADLADQIRRSTSSVALNLSEGSQRGGKDAVRIYKIAAGSVAEVQTAVSLAVAWGYCSAGAIKATNELLDRLRALLWRLRHPRPR